MNKNLIKTLIPMVKASLEGSPYAATEEGLIENILINFTTRCAIFSDCKQVSCILKIAHLEGATPKEQKITDEVEYVLPLYLDDRKYNKGDEVAIHEELEDPAFGLRPIVFRVVHYAFSNSFTDIGLVKSFVNDKAMYDEYVARANKIGLKTLLEENAAAMASVQASADAAKLDKQLDDVLPVAPGPQIVDS